MATNDEIPIKTTAAEELLTTIDRTVNGLTAIAKAFDNRRDLLPEESNEIRYLINELESKLAKYEEEDQ